MAAEIERKFLLEQRWSGPQGSEPIAIDQGYLAIAEEAEVRIRRAGDECTLTVKRGSGLAREEHELRITPAQIATLWPACGGNRLRKRRHLVPLADGLRAEVDVYGGALDGLRVVEVEFPSEAAAAAFEPPPWFGREVTGDRRFANQALAVSGLPEGTAPGGEGRAYRLTAEERADDGMRRIAAGRAETALERLRGLEPGAPEAPSAIHGARKDLKKLRTVVRLLRGELGEARYEEEDRRYRDAGRALSASRDAEVKLQTLAALGERFADLPEGALDAWRRQLEQDRDRTVGGEGEASATEAVELIEAGRARIERWELEADSWELIGRGALRTYRRGRKAMREAEAERSEESFHRWRKRAKDLWYLLRILRPAEPEALGEAAGQAHELADLLGDHHDLAVLRQDLTGRRLGSERAEALDAAITRREDELADAAFDLGHRLYAEKPKAFRRSLRGYWRAWRD